MYTNELQIAKQAEKMLETSFRSKTASFADHINRKSSDVSLKDATAKAKVSQYGKIKDGTKQRYMRSLSIKMAKHGFVQNFGVDGVRAGGTRTRTKPKTTTYSFKAHTMKMKAKPFISDAIEQSGVIDFVLKNITTIRAEEILVVMKRTLENK